MGVVWELYGNGAPISLEFPLMLWINTSIQSSISCTDDIGYGLSEPVWVWVFFWDVALWKKIAHPTMATSSLDHDTYADVSKNLENSDSSTPAIHQ